MLSEQKLKTGTTTVGVVCKDCVILGTESKSTMGYLVASKTSKKVYQIEDRMAITTAGGAGDAQALVRVIQAELNIYKLTRNTDITVKAVTTLMSTILSQNRYYPFMVMLLIGGYDKTGPHLFSIDAVGGVEEEKYTSTGSGSPFAFGVLEDGYKDGIIKEDGIRLVARSIRSARERDIFSGGENIDMVVIDKNGMEFVDKNKIKEMLK